ncbi:MAG: hypothetical protein V5789_14025 [Colwellia sp.]
MSISQHQFEQLTEMGISLWQSRSRDNQDNAKQALSINYIDTDLAELINQQVFTDIVLASGLSMGEISHQGNHIDLGLFNWYFSENSPQSEILWRDQQLITPPIEKISTSPRLKKQLWHVLSKQAL